MKSKKTGVSTNTIIHTRADKKSKAMQAKKQVFKNKKAKPCIGCNYNQDGFCNLFKAWASSVNNGCIVGRGLAK